MGFQHMLGQVEEWEADIEGLQSAQTKKSRSKVDKEKLAKLDENLSRHRRHIERLEQMYRLLDNEALEVCLLFPASMLNITVFTCAVSREHRHVAANEFSESTAVQFALDLMRF